MQLSKRGLWVLISAVIVSVLLACGGGGGDSTQPSAPPSTLSLRSSDLQDGVAHVPPDQAFILTFDSALDPAFAASSVEIADSRGQVPVTLDLVAPNSLRVTPNRRYRLREDHTLTVRTGLKAANGAVLRSDVVRRFRTVLFDGVARRVVPPNLSIVSYSGRYSMRVADVNNDGRLDIVQIGGDLALAGRSNSFAINVFHQNADQSFTRHQNLLVRELQNLSLNEMGDMEVLDLDHDGRPEIVVGIHRYRPGINGLFVFRQTASGHYAQADFLATDFVHRLLPVDIDRDGKLDVLALGQGRIITDNPNRCGMVAVLSRPAGPALQPATVLPCEVGYEALIGRFDASAEPRLVIIRRSNVVPVEPLPTRLRVYRLDAQGRPTLDNELMSAMSGLAAGFRNCSGLMLLEATGDDLPEILFQACGREDGSFDSVIYTRRGGGGYSQWALEPSGRAVWVTDMDRYGLDDVMVLLDGFSARGQIAGSFAKREGGFERSTPVGVELSDTLEQDLVAIGDLDQDGLPDLLMQSYNTGIVVFYSRGR